MGIIRTITSSAPSWAVAATTTVLVLGGGAIVYRKYYSRRNPSLENAPSIQKIAGKVLNQGDSENIFSTQEKPENYIVPISVNYHFTRKCNAECGFCFHTELTSFVEKPEKAKKALRLLHADGMKKLNFAGGEPFLYHKLLADLCKFAKEELKLDSVSIVSNGTKVTEKWLRENGKYIDILAISCDSFNPATNQAIGRRDRHSGAPFDNVEQLFKLRGLCEEFGISFKLNTVICSLNWEEDMAEQVQKLNPFRWKVLQMLVVKGENESEERIRNAECLRVSSEQFQGFCKRHEHVKGFTPEPSELLGQSYLILDEYLRFLDGLDKTKKSECILDVGVQKALKQVSWDSEAFKERGGDYLWNHDDTDGCEGTIDGVSKEELYW